MLAHQQNQKPNKPIYASYLERILNANGFLVFFLTKNPLWVLSWKRACCMFGFLMFSKDPFMDPFLEEALRTLGSQRNPFLP
jgi:hypothetical protein